MAPAKAHAGEGVWRLALDRTAAVTEALLVHAVCGFVLFYGLSVSSKVIKPQFPVIQAVVVDTSALKAARQQRREQEQAELRRQAAERRAEDQRLRDAQRQKEREAQRELERERQLVDQKRAAVDEQSRKLAEEKRRQEDLDRQREAVREKRLQAEAERRQQELEYQQALAKNEERERQRQTALEEERRKQLLAFEDQERLSAEQLTLQQEWVALIATMVRQNWRRPPTARKGMRCVVRVDQLPGGDVISAAVIGGCNADEVTRRSVVDAVLRSEPLPYRGYESVFRRQLKFEFVVPE